MVPSVFMDYDLREVVAKNYDEATKCHDPINLKDLEKQYISKKDIVRQDALKTRIGKIETLLAITSSSKELFKKEYFNARAVEIHRTLCNIFGEGE